MITTTEWLRWHAGLNEEGNADGPSIATSTWPKGHLTTDFHQAVNDCLRALESLNQEMNGDTWESPSEGTLDVPRTIAYAISEIVRMIRDCQDQAHDIDDAAAFNRAAWRVETAWSAVLAGDVRHIAKHVEEEERARFDA